MTSTELVKVRAALAVASISATRGRDTAENAKLRKHYERHARQIDAALRIIEAQQPDDIPPAPKDGEVAPVMREILNSFFPARVAK